MTKGMNSDQAERLVKAALKRQLQHKGINCYELDETRSANSGTLVYKITGFNQSLTVGWELVALKEGHSAAQGED